MKSLINKKYIISTIVALTILIINFSNIAIASSENLNPTKLFSTNIGTSTVDNSPNLGMFADERTTHIINQFSFPPSFSVNTESNIIAILDTINNRVAMFSLDGKYNGEIKLPFKMKAIDLVWYSHTDTMIFVFQNMLKIGIIKIDPKNKFLIKNSLLFDISKVPTVGGASSTITKIIPINITNSSENYFSLNLIATSSNPEFIQTESGIRGIPDSKKQINEFLLKKIKIEHGAIEPNNGSYKLNGVQFVGSDETYNLYFLASYIDNTQDDPIKSMVYRVNKDGLVTGETQIFPSPKIITNRYLFIDKYGLVFFMRADNPQTISFYKFKINDISTSTTIFNETSSVNKEIFVKIGIILAIIFFILIIIH